MLLILTDKLNSEYHIGDVIVGNNWSWNILEVEGSYYITDPSLYLLNKDKEINDFYFCSNPEEFILTYIPEKLEYQLLENPINKRRISK